MRTHTMPGSRTDEVAHRCSAMRHIGDVLGEWLDCYQLGRSPVENRPAAVGDRKSVV